MAAPRFARWHFSLSAGRASCWRRKIRVLVLGLNGNAAQLAMSRYGASLSVCHQKPQFSLEEFRPIEYEKGGPPRDLSIVSRHQ